jgi:hypothetical protein
MHQKTSWYFNLAHQTKQAAQKHATPAECVDSRFGVVPLGHVIAQASLAKSGLTSTQMALTN